MVAVVDGGQREESGVRWIIPWTSAEAAEAVVSDGVTGSAAALFVLSWLKV